MNNYEYTTQEERDQILLNNCPIGEYPYTIVDWAYPDKTILTIERLPYYDTNDSFLLEEWINNKIRNKRNQLLKDCDDMMIIDRYNTMTLEQQQSWTIYRQELRDLPQNIIDQNPIGPIDIIWPIKSE